MNNTTVLPLTEAERKLAHDQILTSCYRPIIEDSRYNVGGLSRLAKFFKKAIKGENLTVGFIGGSITCGEITPDREVDGYAPRIFAWLKNKFPKSTFTYVNAGISATDSTYGVSRMEKQLMSYNPDIVFVDYIANDGGRKFTNISYEAIIRRVLEKDAEIPVVALSFWFATETHFPALLHYNIPTINYYHTVKPYVDDKIVDWYELWHDTIHPNKEGHSLIAACTTCFFEEEVLKKLEEIDDNVKALPQDFCFGNPAFMDATLYQSDEIIATKMEGFKVSKYQEDHHNKLFRYNTWECKDGGEIEFDVPSLKTLAIMKINYVDKGTAEVYVNGKLCIEDNAEAAHDCNVTSAIYFGEAAVPSNIKIVAKGNYIITGLIIANA